jgi:hypothetical protein
LADPQQKAAIEQFIAQHPPQPSQQADAIVSKISSLVWYTFAIFHLAFCILSLSSYRADRGLFASVWGISYILVTKYCKTGYYCCKKTLCLPNLTDIPERNVSEINT